MHLSFLKKKKKLEWNCGNGITEIGWKKKIAIGLWQCHYQNRGVKKKNWQLRQSHYRKWEGKKKVVSEICEGIKKKYYIQNIFTTFSQ